MDFGIIINDVEVDFDGTISLVKNNPIFSDEINHSLQFNLSAKSEINRLALEFIDLPENSVNQVKVFPCQINSGIIQLIGTVTSKYQDGSFVTYFKESGDFYSTIKEKNLSDIPFDKLTFENITYEDMQEIMNDYNFSDDPSFTFPKLLNYKIAEKFPVKLLINAFVNEKLQSTLDAAIIPFIHIHFIFRNLLEKYGVEMQDHVFSKYTYLKKLQFANNYMLNEFALDTTELESTDFNIIEITNEKDPIVTVVEEHHFPFNKFIKLKNCSPEFENRIFQTEYVYTDSGLIDQHKLKILNEDFSIYDSAYKRNYVKPSSLNKEVTGYFDKIYFYFEDVDAPDQGVYMLKSDDYSGLIYIFILDGTYFGYLNLKSYPGHADITNDPNFAAHTFANCSLLAVSSAVNQFVGVVLPDQNIAEGTLIELPTDLVCTFKELNPANHVPNMKISDFLIDMERLGIYTFINNYKAEIHHFKDILNSPESIDISTFSETLRDVDNTGQNGYKLSMPVDNNDDFAKRMLPVTELNKYNVKEPVADKSLLVYEGSETNDVRLVEKNDIVFRENAYYIFNKSFLNAENNWKFLTYNLLNKTAGEDELTITTKFSPLVPDLKKKHLFNESIAIARMDVPCVCNTFKDDLLKCNPRLSLYYTASSPTEFFPYTSSGILKRFGVNSPSLSISWEGEKGLYEMLLKEYLEWQTRIRKDCVTVIHWPMDIFANFRFNKKYRILGVEYLVKSIKYNVDFKNKQIDFNDTELSKV